VKYVKISRGSIREKLECTYDIYDDNKKGFIEIRDINRVINAMLPKIEAKTPNECETLSKECMKLLDPRRNGKVKKGKQVSK